MKKARPARPARPAKADAGAQKRGPRAAQAKAEASNPFDVFRNRKPHRAVLGERVRGERRNIARSRALASSERTKNLLRESLTAHRTSEFRDARVGEGADAADASGRAVQRLVRLRQKDARRTFALGGRAEDLTHGGRPVPSMADKELREADDDSDDPGEADPDDPVARSKQEKADAAFERAEHEKQLGQLDAEFSDILGELKFRPPKAVALKEEAAAGITKAEPDSYDKFLRELAFERKATAVERLKTPEELARERVERLEELERERAARVEAAAEPVEVPDQEVSAEQAGGDASGAEELEEDDEDEDEGEDEEEEEEKARDAESSAGEDEGEDEDDDDRLVKGMGCLPLLSSREVADVNIMVNEVGEEGLPFAIPCPSDAKAVEALLSSRGPRTAVKVIQRIRTCTAVALASENREKLRSFFRALLEYSLKVAVREDGDISSKGLAQLYGIRPVLIELAAENPEDTHSFFLGQLQALSPGTPPRALELCCLKLIALLFPVTDFQHPVTTPAALLADHWAARLAALGVGISDLVSEGVFLLGVLHDFVVPARRFCGSLFRLGCALLASCHASAKAGRGECAEAAVDVSRLLTTALRALAEDEASASAARVAAELVRLALQRAELLPSSPAEKVESWAPLEGLVAELRTFDAGSLCPLKLFEAPPPQIRMLDPIFHEVGDRPGRGSDLSEEKQLKRRLNKERRAASRQLFQDALALQQLKGVKDASRRGAQRAAKTRVQSLMSTEKAELAKLKTESGGGMDTSLKRYAAGKERKKNNQRLGGNVTADTRKPGKRSAANAFDAAAAGGGGKQGPGAGSSKAGKSKRKKKG